MPVRKLRCVFSVSLRKFDISDSVTCTWMSWTPHYAYHTNLGPTALAATFIVWVDTSLKREGGGRGWFKTSCMVISVEKNSRKLSETFIRCFSPPFSLESLDTLLQYVWMKLLKAVFSKMSGWSPSSERMLKETTDLKASMLARGVMPGKFSMIFSNSFFLVIIFAK